MAKHSKTRYAVLGMLTLRPMSGYEIKKMMSESTDYFWSESNGQLYPTLSRLADEGLVECQLEANGAKTKKIYSISPSGREALEIWLSDEVEASSSRNELLLKIFFGHNVPLDVSLSHVKNRLAQSQNGLDLFRSLQNRFQQSHPDMPMQKRFGYATLLYGIKACELEIAWCNEAIELFKQT